MIERVGAGVERDAERGATAARPLSDPGAMRRGAPFLAVALIAVSVGLVGATSTSERSVLVAAAVSMGLVSGAAVSIPWGRLPAWCQAVLPLGFFVVVALLRQARGGGVSGYPPLVMLPVIWMAIYGSRAQLRLAIVGMTATLVLPQVLIGSPMYPSSDWALAFFSIAVAVLGGSSIQRLVEESRQHTADVAALGAITRALTAGADPRPELCRAAQLVTGAHFAVLIEEAEDGMLVATAGTRGLDLSQIRVDPCSETSGTGEAWRTGRRIYVADANADSRVSPRLNAATGSRAMLFQPLTRAGRTTAVLVVGFAEPRQRFPAASLSMVDLVTAEIAVALDRADLVELLASQARTDALTGAANRRSWDEELERALARAQVSHEPLTVALIDMDRFKAYNDTYGHTAGDEVLRDLVTAFRGELRPGDVIARWGGEEFAVALPGCDLARAETIAARLLTVVPSAQTVSIGLAQAEVGDAPRTLVSRADRALYTAKADGRNQVRSCPGRSTPPDANPVSVASTPSP